jgi:hypothetical protein
VDTVVATEYAHYPKENIRSKCNQHRVKVPWQTRVSQLAGRLLKIER